VTSYHPFVIWPDRGTPKIRAKLCSKAICYIAELGGVLKSLRARFSRLMVCMKSLLKSLYALQLKEIGGNLHSPICIFSVRKLALLEQKYANAQNYKDLRGTSDMREADMKCKVVNFIVGICSEKLFCCEFTPVILALARCA
jgi:hypothetical protein